MTLELNDDLKEKKQRRKSLSATKRKSLGPLQTTYKLQPLIEPQQQEEVKFIPPPTKEEFNKNYEEWMKIAADNKINTNNSWNVQLIDYFHELSLMKEGDGINFQKASCTLDGCVKVYSTRVDAVASETNRLLTGLSDHKQKDSEQKESSNHEDEDDEEEGKRQKKKLNRTGNTIEKNITALNVKKFDLEFSIDPLFKKTCADFDEGGANGLLLNHLNLYGDGRIIFDAGDFTESNLNSEVQVKSEMIEVDEVMKLFYEMDLKESSICPSFSGFSFKDKNMDFQSFMKRSESVPELEIDDESFTEDRVEQDMQLDDDEADEILSNVSETEFIQAVGLEDDFDNDHNVQDFGDDGGGEGFAEFMEQPKFETGGQDFSENKDDTKTLIKQKAPVLTLQPDTMAIYSYFDESMLKNWAGPQHWKLQRTKPVKQEEKKKKPKEKKQPFTIDFSKVLEKPKLDLFKQQDTKKTTLMSLKQKDDFYLKNLLPLDAKINTQHFNKLFLKPTLKIETKYEEVSTREAEDDNEPDDVSYMGEGGGCFYEEPFETNMSQFNATQDTQFQEDLVHLKLTKAEAIQYSKKAKKVDVKQLKDRIWNDLETEQEQQEEGFQFSKVIQQVQEEYEPEKQKEITVPFYFICLLHLANEKGLEIQSTSQMNDLKIIKSS